MTNFSGGPLRSTDKSSIEACSMAHINLAVDQKITLWNLERGLSRSIQEISQDRSFDRRMANIGHALTFVKALCDATVQIGAAMGPPPMKAIGALYATADSAVAVGNSLRDGNALGGAKGAVGLMKDGHVKSALELKTISADVIKNAMDGDMTGVTSSMVDLHLKIGEMGVEYLQEHGLDKAKQMARAKYLSVARTVVTAGTSIFKVYEEIREDLKDDASFDKQVERLRAQAAKFSSEITRLDKVIEDCAGARGVALPSISSIPDLKMPSKGPQISARR